MPPSRDRDRSRSPARALDRWERSPSRSSSGRSSSYRGYRQRDYDDRDSYDDEYDRRGYDNSAYPQGDSHFHSPQITGQNATVTFNYYGVAPQYNAAWGYARVGNARMSNLIEPDSPKQIPEALRNKCGACRKNHDIRFCPYPNTEDGRTKICPICDTSKHAWYMCPDYDKNDTWLEWEICWANRRGLPTLVHEYSLHGIFLAKLNLEDEDIPLADRLPPLNTKAGPLSPAFVKRLLPPNDSDDYVQQQLQAGRRLPWQLEKGVLESNTNRPDQVIEDPATKNMQVGNFIPDTKTSHIPKAGKQKYFQLLDKKKRNGEVI